MELSHGSSTHEWRRQRTGDERATSRATFRANHLDPNTYPTDAEMMGAARTLASQVAGLFPHDFNRALPRGYTLCSGALVILKVQFEAGNHHHLYGVHPRWDATACLAFLKDISEGWLNELGAFMRWQLRGEPEISSRFQSRLTAIQGPQEPSQKR